MKMMVNREDGNEDDGDDGENGDNDNDDINTQGEIAHFRFRKFCGNTHYLCFRCVSAFRCETA